MLKRPEKKTAAQVHHAGKPIRAAVREHCTSVRRGRDGRILRIHAAEQKADATSEASANPELVPSGQTYQMSADTLEDQLLAEAQACLAAIRVTGDSDAGNDSTPPAKRKSASAISTSGAAVRVAAASSTTAKVQLRLSKATVQILKAFHKTGRAPSAIVERALWRDPSVQDAAKILRVER